MRMGRKIFLGRGANMVTSSQKKKQTNKQSTNPFPHTLLIWHSSPFFDSLIQACELCPMQGFFFFFKQKMTKQSTSSFCYIFFFMVWPHHRTMPKWKKARFNHMWLNCGAISQTYGWPWLITMVKQVNIGSTMVELRCYFTNLWMSMVKAWLWQSLPWFNHDMTMVDHATMVDVSPGCDQSDFTARFTGMAYGYLWHPPLIEMLSWAKRIHKIH